MEGLALESDKKAESSTLGQEREILIPGHHSLSYIGSDYLCINFFVRRNNNGPGNSGFHVDAVVSSLPFKDKASFYEDTLKGFPVWAAEGRSLILHWSHATA